MSFDRFVRRQPSPFSKDDSILKSFLDGMLDIGRDVVTLGMLSLVQETVLAVELIVMGEELWNTLDPDRKTTGCLAVRGLATRMNWPWVFTKDDDCPKIASSYAKEAYDNNTAVDTDNAPRSYRDPYAEFVGQKLARRQCKVLVESHLSPEEESTK